MTDDKKNGSKLDLSGINMGALKVLNANGKGVIQLDPAEANWITMHAGQQAMDIAEALKANRVPIAQIREVTKAQHGLATLSNKAAKALKELQPPEEKDASDRDDG